MRCISFTGMLFAEDRAVRQVRHIPTCTCGGNSYPGTRGPSGTSTGDAADVIGATSGAPTADE